METQPKHQSSEDFQASCQASIKRVEALMEKIRKIPTSNRPLSRSEEELVDKCKKKLQEIRDLRKL